MTSIKIRLFLNHEQARANEILLRCQLPDLALYTLLRLAAEMNDIANKIKLLEDGKISEYLSYN